MTRDDIAYALGTVAGVSGHLSQPPAPVPGQGWPMWQRTLYANTSCGPLPDSSEWDVVVILPALDPAAGDQLRDMVASALGSVGSLISAEPGEVAYQTDGPTVPSIRYTLEVNEGK